MEEFFPMREHNALAFLNNVWIIYTDELVISTMDHFTLGTYFKSFLVIIS